MMKNKSLDKEHIQAPLLHRACFICGMQWPSPIPVMSRTIDNKHISIRVCTSCKIGITKFTPANQHIFGTSEITEDPQGHFNDELVKVIGSPKLVRETLELQDKTTLTLLLIAKDKDKYKSSMTTDQLIDTILE